MSPGSHTLEVSWAEGTFPPCLKLDILYTKFTNAMRLFECSCQSLVFIIPLLQLHNLDQIKNIRELSSLTSLIRLIQRISQKQPYVFSSKIKKREVHGKPSGIRGLKLNFG